jgi:hypothetical protein
VERYDLASIASDYGDEKTRYYADRARLVTQLTAKDSWKRDYVTLVISIASLLCAVVAIVISITALK